jgi:hypothetical protein
LFAPDDANNPMDSGFAVVVTAGEEALFVGRCGSEASAADDAAASDPAR